MASSNVSSGDGLLSVTVKWSGSDYLISGLSLASSVAQLKEAIQEQTGVLPSRQKLMGLKCKGKAATDETLLSSLTLKPGSKIMMVGTREADLAEVLGPPPDVGEVINDLADVGDSEEVEVHKRDIYLQKVARRVREYEIKVLNPPRAGKKLLVLDVDCTLFDHRSVVDRVLDLMRPYLHEFLAAVYPHYDIVIWSATSMKWVEAKMKELGCLSNENYKLMCMLDSLAMISVHLPDRGLISTKPLAVLWGKFPELYSSKNSILIDDLRRNFLMNPQNGLKIRPYQRALENRAYDRELLKISDYLLAIAPLEDLTSLNHSHWEKYNTSQK